MGEVVVFRKRRGVELVMLILAMGLGVGAFVLTNLNLYEALPDRWWWGVGAYVAIGLFVAVIVTSLVAVRRKLRYEVWHPSK